LRITAPTTVSRPTVRDTPTHRFRLFFPQIRIRNAVSRPTVRDTPGASIPPVFFAKSAWRHAINQANPAKTRQKAVSPSVDFHTISPIWRVQASRSPDSPSIPSNGKWNAQH